MNKQPTLPHAEDCVGPNPNTGIGGNNPPEPLPYDVGAFNEAEATADSFVSASDIWLKTDVTTEALAGQLADQITGLRTVYRAIEAERAAARKVHSDRADAVQAAYLPLLERLTASADRLKNHLADYAAKKAKAAEAERQRKAEEARLAQEEAAKKAAEVAKTESIDAQIEAEKAAKEAAKMTKAAAKPADTSIKSATGAGRTLSQRTIRTATVKNPKALFLHVMNEPEIADALQRVANRIVRAKGFSGELPGCDVITETTIA